MDHGVAADRHVGADPGRRRIDDRHPLRHQLLVLRRLQDRRHIRQLPPAVDAEDLARVLEPHRFHVQPALAIDPHEIGQIVLPLGVRRADRSQRVEQRLRREGVNAAVDLVDRALSRASRPCARRSPRCGRPGGRSGRNPPDRRTRAVNTVAAAPDRSCVATSSRRVAARSSGTSPDSNTTVPRAPARCVSAWSRACPVPSCGSCNAKRRPSRSGSARRTSSARWPTTTTVVLASSAAAARRTCSMRRNSPARCSTLGVSDRMRVPLPAARTTRWMSGITLKE